MASRLRTENPSSSVYPSLAGLDESRTQPNHRMPYVGGNHEVHRRPPDGADSSTRQLLPNEESSSARRRRSMSLLQPSRRAGELRRIPSEAALKELPFGSVRNGQTVLMVSEGGRLVPRVIPSVKQIEKTKPKRLNDNTGSLSQIPWCRPEEDSTQVQQQRRGLNGGAGWGKSPSEDMSMDDEIIEPKIAPPLARSATQQNWRAQNRDAYYPPDQNKAPTQHLYESQYQPESKRQNTRPFDGYQESRHQSVPSEGQPGVTRGDSTSYSDASYEAGSKQGKMQSRAAVPGPDPAATASLTLAGDGSTPPRADPSVPPLSPGQQDPYNSQPSRYQAANTEGGANPNQDGSDRRQLYPSTNELLEAERDQLIAEIEQLRKERPAQLDPISQQKSESRPRLQSLSSQPPTGQIGLISPTFNGRQHSLDNQRQSRVSDKAFADPREDGALFFDEQKTIKDNSLNRSIAGTTNVQKKLSQSSFSGAYGPRPSLASPNPTNELNQDNANAPNLSNNKRARLTTRNDDGSPIFVTEQSKTTSSPFVAQANTGGQFPKLSHKVSTDSRILGASFASRKSYQRRMKFEPTKKYSNSSLNDSSVVNSMAHAGGPTKVNNNSMSLREKLLSTPLGFASRKKGFATGQFVRGRGGAPGGTLLGKGAGGGRRRGCCDGCLKRVVALPSSSLVLLPFHLLLLGALFLYLLLGAYIIQQSSEGRVGAWHWAAVSGGRWTADLGDGSPAAASASELTGRAQVRQVVADKVLDISMEAVLVRSKESVLKVILTSDKMQAAYRAFEDARIRTLPTDDTLQAVSDDVMRRWKESVTAILQRNDYLADLYTLGYEVSPETRATLLSTENPVPEGVSWDYPSAFLYSFCLVTTIGGGSRAGGSIRGFLVVFTGFGLVLYYAVVTTWAARLTDTIARLLTAATGKQTTPVKQESPPPPGDDGGHQPQQGSPPAAPVMGITLLLTLCFVLGMGSLTSGQESSNFGERLENACFALLMVRPPYPLPETNEDTSLFVVLVVVGHVLLFSFTTQLKSVLSQWAKRWLERP